MFLNQKDVVIITTAKTDVYFVIGTFLTNIRKNRKKLGEKFEIDNDSKGSP
jgi:hypothetical protein